MKRKLNATEVKNAKPQDKAYKLVDGGGLYLHVAPNGSRLWRYRYRILGKENLFAIGSYPGVSLAEARERHEEARKLAKQGIHPAHHRKAEKQRAAAEAENTFSIVATNWIEAISGKKEWSESYRSQVERTLKLHVFPYIGDRPIGSIEYDHLQMVLDRVWEQGNRKPARSVAVLLRQWISAIFRYAVRRHGLQNDPTTALRDEFERPPVKHHPILHKHEIPPLLEQLNGYQGRPQTKVALTLLLLTFVRSGELRAAKWSEIDWWHEEWHIPAERMKMDEPHIVPLSRQAIQVLRDLHKITGDGVWLFPKHFHKRGVKNPAPYMHQMTLTRALENMGYGNGRLTPHGFRGIASTLLNEMNYSPDWIELQLAHSKRDRVRASYNHAKYLPQRRQMMQEWADFIDGLSTGANVIPLHAKA